ncbi:MAG: MoxR family ATPase [Bdellovibrionota bacterium]|nr:ATPase [Pseudobdellovibrionaceae bacterium]
MDVDILALNAQIEKDSEFVRKVLKETSKVIVGQREMLEGVLSGLLTGGHILLEGVPGLAKTLTISSMAQAVGLNFQRIQFTPDLMPSDLVGTMIYNQTTGEFAAKKGPLFTNIVLADEINRAPAKVQSALLEAMAEKQVTIGETTYKLDNPFLVLATQNPLEQDGTYPLPEAQMDRFMFKIEVGYPNRDEEKQILDSMSLSDVPQIEKVVTLEEILRARSLVDKIHVNEKLKNYIVEITMATRQPAEYGLGHLGSLIHLGGSPRATISMVKAAKAQAFMQSRGYVTADDVKSIAHKVLRHRLILTYEAEAEDVKSDALVNEILESIEVPS